MVLDPANPRPPARLVATAARFLRSGWTTLLLALFLCLQAAAVSDPGPLALLVSGAPLRGGRTHCFIPATFGVLRSPDGTVAVDLRDPNSPSAIARISRPPREVEPVGLWAPTALRYRHSLFYWAGAGDLTPQEHDEIARQYAALSRADTPREIMWNTLLRAGEGTTVIPNLRGYAIDALALLTFAALCLSLFGRIRAALAEWQAWNGAQRLAAGRCPRCVYEIAGLPEPRCPECGEAWETHESRTLAIESGAHPKGTP